MNYEDILYEVRNHVAWITINRPDKMNALTVPLQAVTVRTEKQLPSTGAPAGAARDRSAPQRKDVRRGLARRTSVAAVP